LSFLRATAWLLIAAAPLAQAQPACLGHDDLQQIRDDLETSLTYLKASKDNFGPGRRKAIEATRQAIAEFDKLQGGHPIAPASSTEVAQYIGEHGHPRMALAGDLMNGVQKSLSRPECAGAQELAALRARVGETVQDIDQAFQFNPRGSRR